MGRYQSVHVSFQTQLSINTLLIELNLDETVWIGADDKVHFSPIDHNDFLDVINHIWQLILVHFIETLVVSAWLEVAIQNLVLMEPLGFQYFIMSHLVRIII